MSAVTIRIRDNGPILVEGPVTVIDGEGNALQINAEKPVSLCRCGASSKKPFCDGTHRTCGFSSLVRANPS